MLGLIKFDGRLFLFLFIERGREEEIINLFSQKCELQAFFKDVIPSSFDAHFLMTSPVAVRV